VGGLRKLNTPPETFLPRRLRLFLDAADKIPFYNICPAVPRFNHRASCDPFSTSFSRLIYRFQEFRPTTMASDSAAKRKCSGADCDNDAGSLQCPTCLKLGIKDSFFCSQDCFKRNWVRAVSHFSLQILLACSTAARANPRLNNLQTNRTAN